MTQSPFDYINSISSNKKDIMVDEKEYNAFIVNRGLSYFQDTIMYSNEMNKYNQLDNRLQYSFLLNVIRPKKRFSKWAKKTNNNDVNMIVEYFGYSQKKAIDVLNILSNNDLKIIKSKLEKGG